MLQRDVRKMTKLYEKLGRNFPAHEAFEPETARGKILIAPPNSLKTLQKEALGPDAHRGHHRLGDGFQLPLSLGHGRRRFR
jgi:hypothetical protein